MLIPANATQSVLVEVVSSSKCSVSKRFKKYFELYKHMERKHGTVVDMGDYLVPI